MEVTRAIAEALQGILQNLNDGAVPKANNYFDHVWIGMPEKIPMGDQNVAIIVADTDPTYTYATGPLCVGWDTDFLIFIMNKGTVTEATLTNYDITDIVKRALLSDHKISDTCLGSTIEDVTRGPVAESLKKLVAGSQITLRCRL